MTMVAIAFDDVAKSPNGYREVTSLGFGSGSGGCVQWTARPFPRSLTGLIRDDVVAKVQHPVFLINADECPV